MIKKFIIILTGIILIGCAPTTSSNDKIQIDDLFPWLNDITKDNFIECTYSKAGVAVNPFTIEEKEHITSKEKYNQIIKIKDSHLILDSEHTSPTPGGYSITYTFTYSSGEIINEKSIIFFNGYIYFENQYYTMELASDFSFVSDNKTLFFSDTTPSEISILDCADDSVVMENFNFDEIEFVKIEEQDISTTEPKYYTQNYDSTLYYLSQNEFCFALGNEKNFFEIVSENNFDFFK